MPKLKSRPASKTRGRRDMVLTGATTRPGVLPTAISTKGGRSGIFPKEMAARMSGLVRRGAIGGINGGAGTSSASLDNMEKSFSRMTIANSDGRFALPTRG